MAGEGTGVYERGRGDLVSTGLCTSCMQIALCWTLERCVGECLGRGGGGAGGGGMMIVGEEGRGSKGAGSGRTETIIIIAGRKCIYEQVTLMSLTLSHMLQHRSWTTPCCSASTTPAVPRHNSSNRTGLTAQQPAQQVQQQVQQQRRTQRQLPGTLMSWMELAGGEEGGGGWGVGR